MGYMRHNTIVVTSWETELLEAAADYARNLGLTILGPSAEAMNGYRTFCVVPDGSKEGWEESDEGDKRREKFRAWMYLQTYEDGSTSLEWFEATYSGDDQEASVIAHAWVTPNVLLCRAGHGNTRKHGALYPASARAAG